MEIYFVRHGQTEYNKLHLHQPETATLTELGQEQARVVARQLREQGCSLVIEGAGGVMVPLCWGYTALDLAAGEWMEVEARFAT